MPNSRKPITYLFRHLLPFHLTLCVLSTCTEVGLYLLLRLWGTPTPPHTVRIQRDIDHHIYVYHFSNIWKRLSRSLASMMDTVGCWNTCYQTPKVNILHKRKPGMKTRRNFLAYEEPIYTGNFVCLSG